MKRTRHVLTIALVATALCADRAVAAAPALRPQVASVAGKLVTRLSVSFKRVVPSIRVYETHRQTVVPLIAHAPISDETVCYGIRLSPLVQRLPPPVL
jgi:hypothetical protein